jgi:hypothetical protein
MVKKATPTTRKRVDLVNFIIDATADQKLAKRFLDCKTVEQLYKFFKTEGYDDVPLNDCEDILKASEEMHGRGIDENGKPVPVGVKAPEMY